MSDCKQDGKDEEEEKPMYMSSPRKRLQQVKRQAKAIDEEVSPHQYDGFYPPHYHLYHHHHDRHDDIV